MLLALLKIYFYYYKCASFSSMLHKCDALSSLYYLRFLTITSIFTICFCVTDYLHIVLYCIMRPYTEDQLDRYHIGIPRENPKSALNLG